MIDNKRAVAAAEDLKNERRRMFGYKKAEVEMLNLLTATMYGDIDGNANKDVKKPKTKKTKKKKKSPKASPKKKRSVSGHDFDVLVKEIQSIL